MLHTADCLHRITGRRLSERRGAGAPRLRNALSEREPKRWFSEPARFFRMAGASDFLHFKVNTPLRLRRYASLATRRGQMSDHYLEFDDAAAVLVRSKETSRRI